MTSTIKSLELIKEALIGIGEDFEEDKANDEISTIANFLLALKNFGHSRYEQLRCKNHREMILCLEAKLRLLRGKIVPAISEEEPKDSPALTAWGKDIDKWRSEGGNCD